MADPVTVIGASGALGFGLALRLGLSGVPIVVGSRDPERAALIERVPGLRCVDCGRLETARITESLTALLIGVNARYKTHAGIRITGLPEVTWDAR